jgi:hypothetical protein
MADALAKKRSRTAKQANAFSEFRELAKSHRFRVQADAEGFPVIHGRYGQIEWYCDGKDCAARFGGFCSLPRQLALAIYTNRPRLFEKLWAIPGVKRHETGDQGDAGRLPTRGSGAGRRGHQSKTETPLSPEAARKLGAGTAYRVTSGHQKTLKSAYQAVTKG